MSDPRTKAERSRAKDLRQGIEESQRIPGRRKRTKRKDKPWKVMSDWPAHLGQPWCWHRAATRELAQAWIEKESRPGASPWRERFWIEGPEESEES